MMSFGPVPVNHREMATYLNERELLVKTIGSFFPALCLVVFLFVTNFR